MDMAHSSNIAQKLLDAVEAALEASDFQDSQTASQLADLKVIARQPANAPCVYCQNGLKILGTTAFGSSWQTRPRSSLEAARVVANALLLQDALQQTFAGLGLANELVDFYSQKDADHEFVGGRILFLLTYKSKVDFVSLIENHSLIEIIHDHLRDSQSSPQTSRDGSSPMKSMALIETLKLLYNLASKCPGQMHFLSRTAGSLIRLTTALPIPSNPLDPPMTQLLNALAIIDWPSNIAENLDDVIMDFGESLVQVLDRSTASLKPAQLETMLIPLITVMRKLNEIPHVEVQALLKLSLLPQDEERDKPLGRSHTVASRLLRLQTSGGLTVLPEAVSGLLFELSDRDAAQFVHNIGYGHAAGYLMTHKIPIPEQLKTTTGESVSAVGEVQLNPITGQRLDAETPITMPEMTDAEKEREAERLFVLFERLKATGVVNVENPLQRAQQSGRLEELSDSDDD